MDEREGANGYNLYQKSRLFEAILFTGQRVVLPFLRVLPIFDTVSTKLRRVLIDRHMRDTYEVIPTMFRFSGTEDLVSHMSIPDTTEPKVCLGYGPVLGEDLLSLKRLKIKPKNISLN